MFDLNTILSAALQQAVEAATKPLLERIEGLEANVIGLSNSLDQKDTRIAALEERGTGGGLTRDEVREIAHEVAGGLIDSHCADYDHNEFVSDLSSALNDVDLMDYIDIDDKVRDAVGNLSFEVSVS